MQNTNLWRFLSAGTPDPTRLINLENVPWNCCACSSPTNGLKLKITPWIPDNHRLPQMSLLVFVINSSLFGISSPRRKKTCFLLALFWYCRELLSGDFNEARLVFFLNWCVVPATSQGHCVLITVIVIVVPASSRGFCVLQSSGYYHCYSWSCHLGLLLLYLGLSVVRYW